VLFWRKKPEKPKTEDEQFAEAIGDLAVDLDRKEQRRRRRRRRVMLPAWLDRRVLMLLAIIFMIILTDAVRRENAEFTATLIDFGGAVSVRPRENAAAAPAQANQDVTDGMVVSTGPQSYASLEFPDGSVTNLGPESVLIVRLLEYSRGGRWRVRSLVLEMGRMWSTVGPNFGEGSEMKVFTPSAVAAVRGTQYAVTHDIRKRKTNVLCTDGYVEVQGFTGTGTWVGQGAESEIGYGTPPRAPSWMSDEERRTFQMQAILNRPIPPEHWLKVAELTMTQALDAPLSILGIGQCSWAVGSADFARRTAAQEQLRRLMQFLEGHEKYPLFVNPMTLAELSIPYDEATRMLRAFNGNSILRYDCLAQGRSYRMVVEARDKKRSRYVLTPIGISKVETQ